MEECRKWESVGGGGVLERLGGVVLLGVVQHKTSTDESGGGESPGSYFHRLLVLCSEVINQRRPIVKSYIKSQKL